MFYFRPYITPLLLILTLISSFGFAAPNRTVEETEVRLSVTLPNVTILRSEGAIEPIGLSVEGHPIAYRSSLTLTNVKFNFRPLGPSPLRFTKEAKSGLMQLLLETIAFRISRALLVAQLSDQLADPSSESTDPTPQPYPFHLSPNSHSVSAIPLRLSENGTKYYLVSTSLIENSAGDIDRVLGNFVKLSARNQTEQRIVNLRKIKRQVHSLNPWDHIDWLGMSLPSDSLEENMILGRFRNEQQVATYTTKASHHREWMDGALASDLLHFGRLPAFGCPDTQRNDEIPSNKTSYTTRALNCGVNILGGATRALVIYWGMKGILSLLF